MHKHHIVYYGLPGIILSLAGLPLYLYLPTFYADELGIGLSTIGIILVISRVWDMVTDPMVGRLHDSSQHRRFGRSWHFVFSGIPLWLLATWMLFVPTQVTIISMLTWLCVFYLAFSWISIPYLAWGAQLSDKSEVRLRLSATREGAIILGTLIAATVPLYFNQGNGLGPSLQAYAVLICLMTPFLIILPVAALSRMPVAPKAKQPSEKQYPGKFLQRFPAAKKLILLYFFNGLANGLPATLFLFYIRYVLEMPNRESLFLMIYFLTGVLSLPLWVRAANYWPKPRLWAFSMGLACVGFFGVMFLGSGDGLAFGVICLLTGVCFGIDLAIPAAIQADVANQVQQTTGHDHAGTLFGFWSLATKLSLAIAVGISFPLLDWYGFVPGEDGGAEMIVFLYAGLPILIKLGLLPFVWNLNATSVSTSSGVSHAH